MGAFSQWRWYWLCPLWARRPGPGEAAAAAVIPPAVAVVMQAAAAVVIPRAAVMPPPPLMAAVLAAAAYAPPPPGRRWPPGAAQWREDPGEVRPSEAPLAAWLLEDPGVATVAAIMVEVMARPGPPIMVRSMAGEGDSPPRLSPL
ncbi:MAG: hypothetical protein ACLPT6_03745 [Desulfobaccales bacterium]